VSTVGFVIHGGRDAAIEAARKLASFARERGIATRALDERVGADETTAEDEFPRGLDVVVAVGGDGTFLRAAHVAGQAGCPVLGVMVGRMGFLTEVEPEEAGELIERAVRGDARVEERLAATAEPDGTAWSEPQWALNELIVEKRARHRLIRLAVFVEGVYVTTFSGDGVIVATPTGSTAYSFSARGPIVSPDLDCLVVTPVAAHMVFDRSFVLEPTERVVLEVAGEEPGLLSADGRESLELPVGCRVTVGAAKEPARLIRMDEAESFYSRVRDKFDLPGDPKL
jgi:NAD+ kinase